MDTNDPRVALPPTGPDDSGTTSRVPRPDGQPDLPQTIDKYKLLQILGEGGMGTVYEAEQTDPVRRRVAVKVIKLGMDTRQIVARFDAERQALAVMDHPGIAKVHDGGATDAGRPYFVMELVHGIPLTDYCDEHKLSTEHRLQLFSAVCDAVHHAHQKGVIHRDLKPANILIEEHDDRPVPKIIDFGIAKAIGQSLTDRTLVTQIGQPVGTPEYMSPEQADAPFLDVDTRSDIYSLGVILYEVLSGTLPFDWSSIPSAALRDVLRESEPPTPSRRFDSLGGRREVIAGCRRTDVTSLRRQLSGDLDWLVMKAMDKDRANRYESAAALRADIQRFLTHEPILARAPSARYRARKFVRRHWAGVAATSFAGLALIVGTVVAVIGLSRARSAEVAARREAATAQKVSDFMAGLFAVSDPNETLGNTITAREILDRGRREIEVGLADQPIVRGRLMAVMGRVYRSLALYADAETLLNEALTTLRAAPESEPVAVIRAMNELAYLYILRADPGAAKAVADTALAISLRDLGPMDSITAASHQMLGMAHRNLSEFDDARYHLARSLMIRERVLGPDHVDTAWSLFHMGWLYYLLGQPDSARQAQERGLAIVEREYGADHPFVAGFLSDMGAVLTRARNYGRARDRYLRALAIRRKVFGPDHIAVGKTLSNLGNLEMWERNYPEAQAYLDEALRIEQDVLGPDNPEVARVNSNLGFLYHSKGEYAEALAHYDRSLRINLRSMGPAHGDVANLYNNMGWLLRTIGHYAEAIEFLQRSLITSERLFGADHRRLTLPLFNLAYAARDLGDYAQARRYAERLVSIQAQQSPENPELQGLSDLALILALQGALDSAAVVAKRVSALTTDQADAQSVVAIVHQMRGERASADSAYARWLGTLERNHGAESAEYGYGLAAHAALRGDRSEAVSRLDSLVTAGYSDIYLIRDPKLLSLHDMPRFQAIVARVKRMHGIDRIQVPPLP